MNLQLLHFRAQHGLQKRSRPLDKSSGSWPAAGPAARPATGAAPGPAAIRSQSGWADCLELFSPPCWDQHGIVIDKHTWARAHARRTGPFFQHEQNNELSSQDWCSWIIECKTRFSLTLTLACFWLKALKHVTLSKENKCLWKGSDWPPQPRRRWNLI